jgi:hypothetical protein
LNLANINPSAAPQGFALLGQALARIFHKAPDFSPPAGFLGKNRLGSRHFFCSAAQQGAIASYVKQKGRF